MSIYAYEVSHDQNLFLCDPENYKQPNQATELKGLDLIEQWLQREDYKYLAKSGLIIYNPAYNTDSSSFNGLTREDKL